MWLLWTCLGSSFSANENTFGSSSLLAPLEVLNSSSWPHSMKVQVAFEATDTMWCHENPKETNCSCNCFCAEPFRILEGSNIILTTAASSSIAFTFPFRAEWSWAEGKIESGGSAVTLIHLWKHTAPRPLLPYRCSPLEKRLITFGPSPRHLLASSPPTCTRRTEAPSLTFSTGSRQQTA